MRQLITDALMMTDSRKPKATTTAVPEESAVFKSKFSRTYTSSLFSRHRE